ncbi:Epididymal-specific lipocalin-8 [Heterocephalus glaber]|uniref:Epididymal-specific lipocalin-8 n=1 Tax=Heterocephalus glaber TaxID=10181 RepID=G5BQR0_HETGA|nr:Epididymal-specific lipocalin-8 [Heterocephalus glaber]
MLGRLLSAILGVLGVLPAGWALEVLDQQKIGGFWREAGVASDQNLVLKTRKRIEGVFRTVSGSNLTVKVVFNQEMHMLDTDYKHYAILRVSLVWRGKDVPMLKYLSKLGGVGGRFALRHPRPAQQVPVPVARGLEDEDEPGFRKFRELTVDTGLYLVAQHGRCAELLKEVSLCPLPAAPTPHSPDGPRGSRSCPGEGRCMVEKSIAPKKVVPGTATITREGGEGSREAQALSTDYETYTIMDILSTAGGASHRVRKLYCRSLDHKQSALQKFREVAQEHGFQEPDFHLGQHDTLGLLEYRVLGTNFRDYAIIFTQLEFGEEAFNTVELYSWTEMAREEAMRVFSKWSSGLGFWSQQQAQLQRDCTVASGRPPPKSAPRPLVVPTPLVVPMHTAVQCQGPPALCFSPGGWDGGRGATAR